MIIVERISHCNLLNGGYKLIGINVMSTRCPIAIFLSSQRGVTSSCQHEVSLDTLLFFSAVETWFRWRTWRKTGQTCSDNNTGPLLYSWSSFLWVLVSRHSGLRNIPVGKITRLDLSMSLKQLPSLLRVCSLPFVRIHNLCDLLKYTQTLEYIQNASHAFVAIDLIECVSSRMLFMHIVDGLAVWKPTWNDGLECWGSDRNGN